MSCLRVLAKDTTVICRKADYLSRCDRCVRGRKAKCDDVGQGIPLILCFCADDSKGPAEFRDEAAGILDAYRHMSRTKGKKAAGWASIMQGRAKKYRTRTMNFARLKKFAPVTTNPVEAAVMIAERLADLDDTVRELVSPLQSLFRAR